MLALILCLAPAVPFWEAKAPPQWTGEEITRLLTDSPWAQKALGPSDNLPGVEVYLATARPMREAEGELARRQTKSQPLSEEEESSDEYRDFLRDNPGKYIVLAVALPDPKRLDDPAERKRLENDCVLKVRGKKFKLVGHFPPTSMDPWLRLVFPRAVTAADTTFRFELYLPDVPYPYRAASFRVKDLYHKGALEM